MLSIILPSSVSAQFTLTTVYSDNIFTSSNDMYSAGFIDAFAGLTPITTDDPKKENRTYSCSEQVDRLVSKCKSTYTYFTSSAGSLCLRIPNSSGAAFCGATAAHLISKAKDWCQDQGDRKKERECL
ncbi:MAG: hypothetical protein ABNH21_13090 [Glaciecola sp.]